MDKNEYFARIFQGQVSSLQSQISDCKDRIKYLQEEITQEQLNLEGNIKLLEFAKAELAKYPHDSTEMPEMKFG